jgi:hypothetical protein
MAKQILTPSMARQNHVGMAVYKRSRGKDQGLLVTGFVGYKDIVRIKDAKAYVQIENAAKSQHQCGFCLAP